MATMTKERKATKQLRKRGTEWSVADLLDALQSISDAVPSRTVRPICTNVLLKGDRLIATDTEQQINVPFPCSETMLLPHARLVEILRTCRRDDSVSLSVSGSSVAVQCGTGKWTMPVQSPDEFPSWTVSGLNPVARLPADQFSRMVRSVAYAVDAKSSRYALGGVMIDVCDGVVSFVATDGRRLSKSEAEIDQAVSDSQTLIPASALNIMGRLASGGESVQLEANSKELVCTIDDNVVVTARLLEGVFPRWRDVIPDRPGVASSEVDRWALEGAIRRAKVCSDENSKGVTMGFSQSGLRLKSQSSSAGEADVTCDISSLGMPVTFRLDPDFVLDWLKNLPADGNPVISVEAVDAKSAIVMRSDDCVGLIMPMADD